MISNGLARVSANQRALEQLGAKIQFDLKNVNRKVAMLWWKSAQPAQPLKMRR